MAKPVAAFETEVEDDFEEVALLPDSDQPQQTSRAAPSWRDQLLSWLPTDQFANRTGFEALGQTDESDNASLERGDQLSCAVGHALTGGSCRMVDLSCGV